MSDVPRPRNPKNTSEVWSGRGHIPSWLRTQIDAGKRSGRILGRLRGQICKDDGTAAKPAAALLLNSPHRRAHIHRAGCLAPAGFDTSTIGCRRERRDPRMARRPAPSSKPKSPTLTAGQKRRRIERPQKCDVECPIESNCCYRVPLGWSCSFGLRSRGGAVARPGVRCQLSAAAQTVNRPRCFAHSPDPWRTET